MKDGSDINRRFETERNGRVVATRVNKSQSRRRRICLAGNREQWRTRWRIDRLHISVIDTLTDRLNELIHCITTEIFYFTIIL